MKLWLDDARPAPDDYDIHVGDARAAIHWLRTGTVTVVSLDHDLGDQKIFGSGYDVAKWIEQAAHAGTLPRLAWAVHSSNPAGALRMRQALQSADRAWGDPS